MPILLIAVALAAATVIWPVNRWVMRRGSRAAPYGFWISLSGMATAGVFTLILGQSLRSPALWITGGITGACYAVGFCILVMHCLRIGPMGPTTAMNNMGMVGPIVVGMFWPERARLTATAWVGLIAVVASLVSFGFSRPAGAENHKASGRWFVLALAAWFLAVLSMTTQYVGSRIPATRGSPAAFEVVFMTVGAAVLCPALIRYRREWFRKVELLGGLVNGFLLVTIGVATLNSLRYVRPEIVFPFTVAGPLVLVMLLGRFAYGERLDRVGVAACGLAATGLFLLSLPGR